MDVRAITGMKALIIAAMSCILLDITNASVTVRIELIKFDNHGSKAYDKGRSCFLFGIGTCCTFFKMCIKPSKDMPSSLSDCWFSNQTTPRNTNTIDFASVYVGLPKVIEINRDSWPGNIGFYIKVYDKDYRVIDELMDIHKYRKEVTAEPNGSRLVNYNETSTGERPHKPASILTFHLQVSCDLNYYGNSCQKYCKEYDDSANGHYGCDKNGDRFCLKGWYNLPNCLQHCLPQNDNLKGHYNCSKNGTRLCHKNWTGMYCNINKNKAVSTFALPSSQSLQSLLSQTKTVLKPRTSVILLSRSIGHITLKSSAISPTLMPSVEIRQSSITPLLQMSRQSVVSSRYKFSEHSSLASTAMFPHSVSKLLTKCSITAEIKASKAPRNSALPSSAILGPTQLTPDNIASATDDFQWMVSTRRGILVLIGFALALVFLACFLCALVKICRMRRHALQPQRFHNDSDNTEEIHIKRQCDVRKLKSLQMCTGCFGGVPGQLGMQTHNYPYQKQETDM
ncbi:uncharacterized protein LOC135692626 isoform X2 [Rhopilema esculentum]|uniref:uncharacterized protein LOC135692626 isoform X2 n=1 Tax=Rhopilema esculentum TaxID=499914 RepID=UPI0031DB84F0